jgi:hypothetical protein
MIYMLSIWEPTRSVSIYHVRASSRGGVLRRAVRPCYQPGMSRFFQVRLSFNATSLVLKEKGSGSWRTNVTSENTGRVTLDPATFRRRKGRSAVYGTITNDAMIQCDGAVESRATYNAGGRVL